jgi:bifunctional N-acetylglucosamine-1-phosphate-uridyltransferase/glucosamine-1-phosphate-acetyltransferase GlmU-like protein
MLGMDNEKTPAPLASVVLAAGRSTRMRAGTNKVLLPILGKPMIRYQVEALRAAGIARILLVVGTQAEAVKAELGSEVEYVLQAEPKGTGHALVQARERLEALGPDLDLVVTVGDNPYITADILRDLIDAHRERRAEATIVTASFDEPPPYGRVVRDAGGRVLGVVEELDATPGQKLIKEVHVSIYAFRAAVVLPLLDEIRNDNAKGEYYLPDIIGILAGRGYRVETVPCDDPRITLGINTPEELEEAERYFSERPAGR